jgi:Na+/H+ antiporter NhaA
VPVATDIADDVGAILVIGLFYAITSPGLLCALVLTTSRYQ